MQTTLAQFNENPSLDAFALQNPQMLRVRLEEVAVHARAGSVVALQGTLEETGQDSSVRKALGDARAPLVTLGGDAEVFLADRGRDVHLVLLEDEELSCHADHLLAFDALLDWDLDPVGDAGDEQAGLTLRLRGTGWIALLSDGAPVLLAVSGQRTSAAARSAIAWSREVEVAPDGGAAPALGDAGWLSFEGTGWVLVQPSSLPGTPAH